MNGQKFFVFSAIKDGAIFSASLFTNLQDSLGDIFRIHY
jgi:hypothetical protein